MRRGSRISSPRRATRPASCAPSSNYPRASRRRSARSWCSSSSSFAASTRARSGCRCRRCASARSVSRTRSAACATSRQLSGNDFLPLAVKLDDLLSHLAIQGEVVTRLREWRMQKGELRDRRTRGDAALGDRHRHHDPPAAAAAPAGDAAMSQPACAATQKIARLSDLSQESLEEMAQFLADMYGKRVSLVVVGLEDVPGNYRRIVEKILGQLIHNAIRHGVEVARRSRRAGQAGDRHGRRAVRADWLRWIPAQRAGRRPRTRSRQDPRRSRAPGCAHQRRRGAASIRASSRA